MLFVSLMCPSVHQSVSVICSFLCRLVNFPVLQVVSLLSLVAGFQELWSILYLLRGLVLCAVVSVASMDVERMWLSVSGPTLSRCVAGVGMCHTGRHACHVYPANRTKHG